VQGADQMRPETFELFKNNVIKLNPNGQAASEPDGITALYERLSQEDRNDGESNSIANQKKILERYCKTHGYIPYQHYDEDDGYSGTTFDRPGFQRMLADIKAGRITRVIVKDMSRFGRDYLQVGLYTDILFPEHGVHFIAVNDGVDSTRGENEFTAIRNVFNEMYARDTSKKIRATFQSKGKSGEHLSSHPPYGYMKDAADPKKWVVDEEAAAVVQKVFSLCIDGMGVSQIARWLTDNDVPTPSAHFAVRDGLDPAQVPHVSSRWLAPTVGAILDRIEYLGHTVNFKTYKKSYKSKQSTANDPQNWAVFENTQEPVIEESVFALVQNIRKSRKRPTRTGRLNEYAGMLYCGECDAKMYLTRKGENQNGDRFVCSTYRNGGGGCIGHSIMKSIMDKIVVANLREAIAYVKDNEAEFVREAETIAMRVHDKELATKKDALGKTEKRIAELDGIIMRLYEDNVAGKLTDERFIKLSRDYEREQESLKASCTALRETVKQQEKTRQSAKSFIAAAKKYTELQELDATVLREFIDRIIIYPKDKETKTREIEIIYNFIGAFDFNKNRPFMMIESNIRQRKVGTV
jgi:DNA invertase Pin-like site-specific DNA recombinase